jgi:hypothetical protein
MALFLMESEQEFDARNSYYLQGHAPAVGELGGSFARMSGYVVDGLAVVPDRTRALSDSKQPDAVISA